MKRKILFSIFLLFLTSFSMLSQTHAQVYSPYGYGYGYGTGYGSYALPMVNSFYWGAYCLSGQNCSPAQKAATSIGLGATALDYGIGMYEQNKAKEQQINQQLQINEMRKSQANAYQFQKDIHNIQVVSPFFEGAEKSLKPNVPIIKPSQTIPSPKVKVEVRKK